MLRNLVILVGLYAVWRLVSNALRPRRRRPASGRAADPEERRYSDLTDQEISDADYEDLDGS